MGPVTTATGSWIALVAGACLGPSFWLGGQWYSWTAPAHVTPTVEAVAVSSSRRGPPEDPCICDCRCELSQGPVNKTWWAAVIWWTGGLSLLFALLSSLCLNVRLARGGKGPIGDETREPVIGKVLCEKAGVARENHHVTPGGFMVPHPHPRWRHLPGTAFSTPPSWGS